MPEQPAVDTVAPDPGAVLVDPEAQRAAYIDEILQGAIDRAQTFIRAGRFGRGEYELVRAEMRVARISGDTEAADQLEQIRYFEYGARR